MPTLVLIHSPLVGAMTWAAVAGELEASGQQVSVPSLPDLSEVGPPYYESLAATVADRVNHSVSIGPIVLVGHSGAGALLPAIAEALDAPITAAAFVDAILPHPRASWFDSAPELLRTRLEALARNGQLPPWNEWVPPDALAALLPDDELRSRFIAELRPVPAAYLEEPAPPSPSWPPCPCGYLQLSEGYGSEAEEAERRGWPTVRRHMHHLSMLTDPTVVSVALRELVSRLT